MSVIVEVSTEAGRHSAVLFDSEIVSDYTRQPVFNLSVIIRAPLPHPSYKSMTHPHPSLPPSMTWKAAVEHGGWRGGESVRRHAAKAAGRAHPAGAVLGPLLGATTAGQTVGGPDRGRG